MYMPKSTFPHCSHLNNMYIHTQQLSATMIYIELRSSVDSVEGHVTIRVHLRKCACHDKGE